jgi:flagellar export protein FliJ
MKPFKFTLESVRILRQRKEQEAMDHYARMLLARRQAVERMETAQGQVSAGWQALRNLVNQGCEAAKAAQMQMYQRALKSLLDECIVAVGVAERRVNAAQQAMLMARQQREIVDSCFDKQKARHQRETARAEQKFLDDLAGRRSASMFAWNPI